MLKVLSFLRSPKEKLFAPFRVYNFIALYSYPLQVDPCEKVKIKVYFEGPEHLGYAEKKPEDNRENIFTTSRKETYMYIELAILKGPYV